MHEFDLINRIVAGLGCASQGNNVVLGPGDDCAQLEIPSGHDLVSSIDTLIEGRHFPKKAPADLAAYRAMAVNISDLAAMGAKPSHALLAMTIPKIDEGWIDAFCRGIRAASLHFECPLVGGNITRGALSISVSVHGCVKRGRVLTRSGATPGELLCTTGDLGGANLALNHPKLSGPWTLESLASDSLAADCLSLRRYYLPEPPLGFARDLVGLASAAIDISDGLVADATHLAKASGVGLNIRLDDVACFPGSKAEQAIVAGDDYQLCFSLPEQHRTTVMALAKKHDIRVGIIGQVVSGEEVALYKYSEGKKRVYVESGGYQHF